MKQGLKLFLWAGVAGVVVYGAWRLVATNTPIPSESLTSESSRSGVESKVPLTKDVVGERMSDTNYVAALTGLIGERREVIVEAQAVRHQMNDVLTTVAATLPDTSAGESAVKPFEAPEATAPVTAVSTNTALSVGTKLRVASDPVVEPFENVEPTLLVTVRQQPEWMALEARLNVLAASQQDIKIRTETLIRERMQAQYAARAAEKTSPLIRPPAHVIKPKTNAPDFYQTEPEVRTNMPSGGMKLPPMPERKPVTRSQQTAQQTPSNFEETDNE